jgi:YihY family inner membrane protein
MSSNNAEHERPEQERESAESGTEQTGVGQKIGSRAGRFDAFQQEHKAVGIPVAVLRKFVDDQSTNLASMIAFWAFFSIFPLLLVFVTLLGFFVPAQIKGQVLGQVANFLPLLDPTAVGSLSGQWWTLIVGIVSALWSGTAVVRTVQAAFNSVWEIPYKDRPGLGEQLGRSLLVLATLGVGLVVSTVISSFVTGAAGVIGPLGMVAGYVIAILLDVGLFIAAFRMLTDRDVTTRDVLPGALLSGLVFWVLQQLSSLIISRYLQKAQSTYGSFATVITLLWWFYLQAVVTMLGAQLNVVLKERLHPRALGDVPGTEADHRGYQAYAAERTYHDNERVRVEFPEE